MQDTSRRRSQEHHATLSRVESLDHHLGLPLVGHEEAAVLKDRVHRLDHFVEAARSSSLLCDADDAQVVPLAMLDDRHDLCGEGHFLDVEIYCARVLVESIIKTERI